MFCFQCGRQIRDDAVFCQYCGTKQHNSSKNVSVRPPSSNGELNRDALKIYLGNILSLECIKASYERKIGSINYNIRLIESNNYIKRYLIKERDYFGHNAHAHFWSDGETYAVAFDDSGYRIFMGPSLSNRNNFEWKTWRNIAELDFLKHLSWWEYFEERDCGFFEKREQRAYARDTFFKACNSFISEAPSAYRENVNKINLMHQQREGITQELASVAKLLESAYAINIIPSQFRYNIHAIFYLHDFVATSMESFTTALLHFDLDEIKAKLDKIISQQESIIIQNAVMIAQNEKILTQNQQQLERLSRIESNTSQAAQYAQIAANNAETCAWISMANYIEAHR